MLRLRTVREGSVGLFALLGLVLFAGLAIWLRGGAFGRTPYQVVVEFEDASGLQIGAPVRFRGVTVGKIASLKPSSQGVDVTLEIDSTDLRIPRQATIQANRYGLIGETSVDITPSAPLSEAALAVSPTSADCQESRDILCDGDRVRGESGSQLMASLTRLSEVYSDPAFVNNLQAAAQNAARAANRIAKLGEDLSVLTRTVQRDTRGVPTTIAAITETANEASQLVRDLDLVVRENRRTFAASVQETSQLIATLNQLAQENRHSVPRTLESVAAATDQVRVLAANLEVTVREVNTGLAAADTATVARDLQTLIANTAETSANLRELSETLNDPANRLVLQQTLDSARATFENAQKITADLDELTGDPAFRQNVRNLINGLSSLVSSAEQLERQVKTVQVLESATQQLAYQIESSQRLRPLPTPVETGRESAREQPSDVNRQGQLK